MTRILDMEPSLHPKRGGSVLAIPERAELLRTSTAGGSCRRRADTSSSTSVGSATASPLAIRCNALRN